MGFIILNSVRVYDVHYGPKSYKLKLLGKIGV